MKQRILKVVFVVWIVLWIFFLAREDKDGQYGSLSYLYTHGYGDNVRHITGGDLYAFVALCGKNMPEGSTYQLAGFKKFSIDEVRVRYLLWPLRNTERDADFMIVYGGGKTAVPGYEEYKTHGRTGRLLMKKDGTR